MTIENGPMPAPRQDPSRPRRRPSARMLAALATWFATAAFAGCGEHDLPPGITKQAVALDDVPASLREAARKAIPEAKINEAWKNLDPEGKLHSYEIRGRNPANGKVREVRVSLTGEILESE